MDSDQIRQLIDQAHEAIEGGQYAHAIELADQLEAVCPEDAEPLALRAEALLKADNAEAAFHEARRAVDLAPESDRMQSLLGLSAWRSARLTLAQQSLERAIELSNGKPGLLVDYAWFMASERGPRLGEEAALRAIAAADKSSTAWAALGMAQFRLHRRQEATQSLSRALQLDPNDPYAQLVMAKLLQDRRQDNKAIALASLLADTPGTEDLVEQIRQQAKQRQVAMKLVERKALPEKPEAEPRQWSRAMGIAGTMIAMLLLLAQPTSPLGISLCVLGPLLVLWGLHRLLS
jgi:Tfp pilus assembly protein PilF